VKAGFFTDGGFSMSSHDWRNELTLWDHLYKSTNPIPEDHLPKVPPLTTSFLVVRT
jgi:hypothetical protein